MGVSKSDNAILAKAHALFGRRLDAGDYTRLLQKRTISEIAGYLKNETHYSEVLSEVKEELVHREQLELMLKRRALDIYIKVRRYSQGEHFLFRAYRMRNEIMQLISAMRLLNADAMNKFIVSLPGYLAKHLSFDLYEIAKAKDYDGLLEVLSNTDYYAIIGRFRPLTRDTPINIPACESALLTYYYSKMFKMLESGYSERARESLKRVLYYQIDLHNVSMILRMKRYFNAPQNVIASYLIPVKAKLSGACCKELLEISDIASAGDILKRHRVSDIYPDDMSLSSERVIFYMQQNKMRISRRIFRFSNFSDVAVMCYMMMLEIEIYNIFNIIEGVRYQIPPEEIRSMLVI